MALHVACVLGARANAWHSEVFRQLPPDVAATVVGTTGGRYPTADLGLPVEHLRWENEVGSYPRRKLASLRYRLTHERTGWELRLAGADDVLGRFDVIDTWELFTEWTRVSLDAARAHRRPVVVTVWDNLAGHFDADPRRGPIRRRALAEADRFLVVTARSQAALELDGVDPVRIVRGKPSVDAERFAPGRPDAALRARLGASAGDVLVLAVARLEPSKGLAHLVDALALARREHPGLRLAIAGSGAERPALERRIERLGLAGQAVLVGEVPYAAMPELHRAADVFVLPSVPTPGWQEQWGQSLLEAMAAGRACVGTLSGGIPETLGDAGLLVPPADPLALASALGRLAADAALREGLGKAARARVGEGYAHRDQARLLADLFRDLASRRARESTPRASARRDAP